MSNYEFDTTGEVIIQESAWIPPVRWAFKRDLTPLQQGYIEAMFAELAARVDAEANRKDIQLVGPQNWRFSDLAPETLARVIEDCKSFSEMLIAPSAEDGRTLWVSRNEGYHEAFPPLTLALNEYGKVVFEWNRLFL